ncbi:MAG: ABC transporter permease [Gorillibacterium sp.]|nr:ABC transporter permease [Gorillibacterium sp.]
MMSNFWPAFRAELIKQQRTAFSGKAVFFSLLLWPVLTFFSSYYAMQPFRSGKGSAFAHFLPDGNLLLFLITGFAVFQLYWSVVQSAWTFEWERKNGTLEIVFLAPGSRMAFLFGRSVHALYSGLWMFLVFATCVFIYSVRPESTLWLPLLFAFLLTLVAATIWGAFLCALCLFSRDSGYLYYIFQEPMKLFGGVAIPPAAFPIWGKALSFFFPVSYSLYLIRGAVNGQIGSTWWMMAGGLAVACLFLLYATFKLAAYAETYARRTGSWTLF